MAAQSPVVQAGQGIFSFGLQPIARVLVDSTKPLSTTAQALAGAPASYDASANDVTDQPADVADFFMGAFGSNVNDFEGRVSLGGLTPDKANCELSGRYLLRDTVFLDSSGAEKTAHVFTTGAGAVLSLAQTDVGKTLHAVLVTVGITGDAFDGNSTLRWVLKGDGGTVAGFENVAQLKAISDDLSEVEIELNASRVNYDASFTA